MRKPPSGKQGEDLFGWWMRQDGHSGHTRVRKQAPDTCATCGIRCAFYGRISTEDWQDRFSSGRW